MHKKTVFAFRVYSAFRTWLEDKWLLGFWCVATEAGEAHLITDGTFMQAAGLYC